jgi:hypothetical protein
MSRFDVLLAFLEGAARIDNDGGGGSSLARHRPSKCFRSQRGDSATGTHSCCGYSERHAFSVRCRLLVIFSLLS